MFGPTGATGVTVAAFLLPPKQQKPELEPPSPPGSGPAEPVGALEIATACPLVLYELPFP